MLPIPTRLLFTGLASCLLISAPVAAQEVFINELHYDNAGADAGEFIEVAGPAGTDLSNFSLVLYNGNGGAPYNTVALSGSLPDDGGSGIGARGFLIAGIQNGSPDGVALVEGDTVIQFLSYEGSFTAVGGPADGLTSSDIGVQEASSAAIGTSLQLAGEGADYTDFTWQGSAVSTIDSRNNNQVFVGGSSVVVISEIHYDNTGADTGEAIEVTGTAGSDLSGWSLVLYNGSNGTVYATETLVGVLSDQNSGFGALSFPISGIQNGAPDGVALVNGETVVQFLSYEGSFTAVGGPADGLTSEDIGVSEPGDTPLGLSLQLSGCAVSIEDLGWSEPVEQSFGTFNPGIELVPAAEDCVEEPPAPAEGIAFINEIHYDNAGSDTGEAVEVAGTAGLDLTGWSLVLYNGNGGSVYNTVSLAGLLPDQLSGFGALSFPISGIQNGAPDGLALVNASGDVVQFLSYEGTFTAVGGPADGLTSTDIDVSEGSSTAVGSSLQVTGCSGSAFTWDGPQPDTFGAINTGQTSFANVEECLPDLGGGEEPPPEAVPATVPEIQGAGPASPLLGQTVVVTAVVTGDFDGDADSLGDLSGFFMQDGGDNDATTSDGVFVFAGSTGVTVSAGDLVRVTGIVGERFEQTQISATDIQVLGPGSLPSPALIEFPLSTVDELESFEGMLVSVPQTMTVTGLSGLDNFGEVLLAANGRQVQFTQQNAPDVTLNSAYLEEQANNRLLLDDGQDGSLRSGDEIPYPPPALAADNLVRVGDSVTGLVGNLGFGFSSYRLRPTQVPVFVKQNPRPDAAPEVGGRLRIVSFNVENFFNDLGRRGADTPEQLSVQIDKLVQALSGLDADLYGLVELENDSSEGASSAIAELAAALNASAATSCSAGYDYAAKSVFDPTEDEIAVGMIFCTDSLRLAPGTELAVLNDTVLGELGLFTRPLFNGNRTNRTPIAATFEEMATGEAFTVSVNHFKSKSPSGCNEVTPSECDINDGAGAWNAIRTEAANALAAWLATNPTGSADPDVIILGDLNAYAFEAPITTLEAAGFEDLGKRELGSYGFIFDGFTGTLDYAMTSSDLSADVAGVAEWHINADESDAFEYAESLADPDSPFRTSDHDPLLVGIDLDDTIPPTALSCGTPPSGTIQPRDRGIAFTATASDAQDADPIVEVGNVRCERRLRFFTIPYSFCWVQTSGDTIRLILPGGARNRISWTATARDDAGNHASRECFVDVVPGRRLRH